jgi:sortase A
VIRRVVRGTGKTLIATGVLILLFVAYQLWGTGLAHDRDQRRLRSSFAAELAAPPPSVPAAATSPSTVAQPLAPSENVCSQCAAVINIPKIGLDEVVVEGVGVEELKEGVGHYPDTKLPGEKGNAALAGHRTTYGHPFNRIDELGPGDEIVVTTRAGTFHYQWMEKKVVTPETVSVLDDTPDDRLTLTTCNPKYSAAERLIVVAKLMTPPVAPPANAAPAATTPSPPRSQELAAGDTPAGLSGAGATSRPAIAWGILAACVWLAAWAAGRWSGRRWTAYLIGTPIFLVLLFMFFENFARLLPANV